MTDGIIRQLTTREVYRTPWMSIREDEVEFPSGARGIYSVVDKADFVLVLPFTGDGFWLVQQYRYPVASREWEFPQGGWATGKSGTSSELAAAELREETGLSAGAYEHLGRLYAGYGFSSQSYDVFLATDLVPGDAHREVTEQDMIHEWRATEDVVAMLRAGELADAHSVAAFALWQLHV
jgi:8-oxo-dGTP pyrophosphatase MutT (NUDIX family)